MSALLAAARALHFAASIWLFGELVFACVLSFRRGADTAPAALLRRRLPSVARWSVAIAVASAAAWLVATSAMMSGLPAAQAMTASALRAVLGETLFGRVWIIRLCLAAALLAALWKPVAAADRLRLAGCAVGAAIYLGALAWTGHAAAAEGPWRAAHIGSDVVHLLAAGGWLGALPGLAFVLPKTANAEDALRATRRFSAFAIACVAALILSGIGNSWFLVGSLPALAGTDYGRLLLLKLALLAAMLGLAAVNRTVLTPRLANGDRRAQRALCNDALLEIIAGALVLIVVGVLGTLIPAAHQSTVWPFAYTLDWEPARDSRAVRWLLVGMALVALGCVAVFIGAVRRGRLALCVAGAAGLGATLVVGGTLLAVPAWPTTYAVSPVRYTTAAIVDGARFYAQNCAACHGSNGAGDGPAAAALGTRPPNLVVHSSHHRPGELYWWIAHGLSGSAMPAFVALGDDAIWSIIRFLQARSEGASATATSGAVSAEHTLAAPDFAFELRGRGQQTLLQPGDDRATLIVVYALPQSLARLRALIADRHGFDDRRVRVVAVAPDTATARAAEAELLGGGSMLAITPPDVARAYAILGGRQNAAGDAGDERLPGHAEFLVDRRGYLRARWIGVPGPGAARTAAMLDAAPTPAELPAPGHVH